ncbi:MAG TPA: ABC transporter substrate-binding protein [Propionicimonas sp.]|jgi:peptide/nickel transport system substrate-binding protein|uniref:ABC transporter substrate-binding protein n=1 Tax=Propionicimonas sp. TaxID=1955623 RepID=UPI002F42BA50
MIYAAASSRRSRSIPTRALAAAVVLALTVILAACTPTAAPSPSVAQRTLSVGATLEPASMDPWHNTAASIPQVLLYNVYETLVKVDSSGNIKPLLAQAWEVSPDRTTYTFHLNPAAKFASGAPVDAAAVVANINRLKADAKITETLRAQLTVVASAEATGTDQVQVKLTRPSVMWLYDMSSTLGMMLDPAATGDLATTSAGSGPYTVKAHNQGQSVVLANNTKYWGNPARFDEVTFRYFTDPSAMNAAMLGGDLDVISNLQAPDALPQFADTTQFTTISGTTNGEVVLGLNHQNKALAKLQVRQALTMAIDRKALMDTVWNGQGTLIGSMAVPTDPWYEDLTATNAYDPEKAKALLKEAGASSLSLRLRVPVVPYAVKSAQFVASQLRDVGVKVTIEELDFTRWLDEVFTKGDYDMTIVAHVEARDLGKFANPKYYWRYNSPKFAELYTAADEATSDEQATELMKQAVKYLADDAAAIWLFALPNLVITKATITGVAQNATTLSFDLTTITSR